MNRRIKTPFHSFVLLDYLYISLFLLSFANLIPFYFILISLLTKVLNSLDVDSEKMLSKCCVITLAVRYNLTHMWARSDENEKKMRVSCWPFSLTGHLRIEPFCFVFSSLLFYFISFYFRYLFLFLSFSPLLMFFNSFSLHIYTIIYPIACWLYFVLFHPADSIEKKKNWYPGALLFISALDIYPIWIVFVLFCCFFFLFLKFLLYDTRLFSFLLAGSFFFLFLYI